ncbi:MAG: kelch repeat-containing protein [Acidobacteria bacterium]|nr:kelch repeat-containing protein [Acidobacteriota bacterium]
MRSHHWLHSLVVIAALVAPVTPATITGVPMVSAAAAQITKRHEHGYVQVGSRFYLLGGRGINPVDIFDPATGTWSKGAASPVEMHHFQAVVFENRIYVVGAMGGQFPKESPLANVYVYDPTVDRWTTGPEIPAGRRRGGAGAVLHNGEIVVIAGITNGHYDGHVRWVDAFNPRTGQWRVLPDAPRARDHFHAAIIGGRIYAAAGRRSSAATNQTFELTVPEVDVFDLASSRWSTLPAASNIPTPRAGAGAVALNGRLIVLGGESGGQELAHADVEELDPATGRWRALQPLAMGRHATQAVLHDGRIYLASGSRTRGATEVDTQEIYTPKPR